MKKIKLVLFGLVLFVGMNFYFTEVASADSLSSLSEEVQQLFIDEGFSENDEFTVSSQLQTGGLYRAVNVINLAASTKRVNSTMGHTMYVITSGKPILAANTIARYGSYNSSSKVDVYGRPGVYSGGIYISYTGKSKYFSVKVESQVTTTMGTTPVNGNAGGLTLGN